MRTERGRRRTGMKMRTGIMVNSSIKYGGAYISLTGRMIQAVDVVPAERVGSGGASPDLREVVF
jgi:hypothetical protein